MRRTKVFLAGAAAAAVLTACSNAGGGGAAGGEGGQAGGESGGGGAQAAAPAKDLATLVSDVSEQTTAKKTVKFNLEMSAGKKGTISGTGELDMSKDKPSTHTKLSAEGQGAKAMAGGETITIGDATYIKGALPASNGKPWAKLDLKDNNPLAKIMNAMGDQAQQSSDPAQTLDQLKAGGTLTGTEQETVAGQQTTRYTVKVDMKKLAEKAKDKQTKTLLQAASKMGITDYPVTLWVAKDNLPVQMKVETPMPGMAGGQQQSKEPLTVTVKYRDWGKPVSIQAPPADQVGELKMPKIPSLNGAGGGAPAPSPGG